MDVFEKLFQKIAQKEIFKKKENPGELYLRNLVKALDVLANSLIQNSVPVQCVASRDFVGMHGTQLLLPERINYFTDSNLNKKLYQNLILQIIGAQHLKFVGSSNLEPATRERINFLKKSGEINSYLDGILPGYFKFQENLIKKVEDKVGEGHSYHAQVFKFWQDRVLSRTQSEFSTDSLVRNVRGRDPLPLFLYFSTPCFGRPKSMSQMRDGEPARSRRKKEGELTEKEKSYSGINQEIDLDKEQANPVMHSFEKLETADEYSGGRTVDSGDDQINDHSNALDELNLTKVTRGGEAAKSVYNAETHIDIEFLHTSLQKERAGRYFYPEWNNKKNHYMRNHCQLIEDPIRIKLGNEDFKDNLISKYRFQIKRWQSRIQHLFSEPLWHKKQAEGDEIDIDEVIRDYGAMLGRQNVDARWYMSRKKRFNDIEVIILFDQSQSSDSWLANRRVLEISLEAVGKAGLLFDQIIEAVSVVGIWSSTRHNCSFQFYKRSHESWSSFYRQAPMIEAQGYTRLGPAIRHANGLLQRSAHKKKLILLLTDGKPTDVDGYEGAAGIIDVAQACREAEASGILPYALVLDVKQKSHFSKMFRHYTLLYDPKFFSEELFKILLRILRE